MLYFAYFKQHFVMLRILKNYPQNAGNGISETPDFKIFRGSMLLNRPSGGLRIQRSHSLRSHNSMTSHLWSASPLFSQMVSQVEAADARKGDFVNSKWILFHVKLSLVVVCSKLISNNRNSLSSRNSQSGLITSVTPHSRIRETEQILRQLTSNIES